MSANRRHTRRLGWLPAWRPGKLAGQGTRLLGWMLLRAAAQAATVVLAARHLGAHSYGLIVAILAVAALLSPLVGGGLAHVLLRNAARDPANEPAYLAIAWRGWRWTWAGCALLACVLAWALLPARLPLEVVCAAIIAELVALSLTELAAKHRQAQQRMHAMGAISAGLPLLRLLALAALLLAMPQAGVEAVLWTYAGTGLLFAFPIARELAGRAATGSAQAAEPMRLRSGMPFTLAGVATRVQAEFNKPVLARLDPGLAGNFNIGQRAVDIASLPLVALQEALWPRLYAQADPRPQWRRTGALLLLAALLLGGALTLVAPWLPRLLGPSYEDAVSALQWLAWLPLLQTARNLVNFRVIHRGQMGLIGWAYGIGAIVSIVLVAVVVPRWGLAGAAACAYATELTMILTLVAAGWRMTQHAPRHT